MIKTLEPNMASKLPPGEQASVNFQPNRLRFTLAAETIATRRPDFFVKIPTQRGFQMFRVSDIVRIETHSYFVKTHNKAAGNGDGNSTHLYTTWGGCFQMNRKIADWIKLLAPAGSFRQAHQSHLINTRHIRRLYDEDGMVVEMVNGDLVPVSIRRKTELIDELEGAVLPNPV